MIPFQMSRVCRNREETREDIAGKDIKDEENGA